MNQEYLEQIPPRKASEPDATVHQLTFLWNAGYQNHDHLGTLGREQARWLIAKSKGEDPDRPGARKSRRTLSWGAILLVLLLLGGFVAHEFVEVPSEPAEALAAEEASPAGEGESPAERSVIDPSKQRRLSFSSVKENLRNRFRRQAKPTPTPPLRPGERATSERVEIGKDYILKKPVGVQVKEGVIVLQTGSRIAITAIENDRVTFRHPFGQAEATLKDLTPEPPQPAKR